MSEELIDALVKVEGLRVPARTSSFSFKGKNQSIQTIAHELSVSNVLEGSVRKAGSRLRVTAQLINASNGFHIWSDTYDREVKDVIAVQDEIAQKIVGALRITLSRSGGSALIQHNTEDLRRTNCT
jgi:TolB-like protein